MKNGWKTMKLGDVCDFEGGSQPPKSEFVYKEKLGYIRFLQIRDFGSDKNVTFIPHSKKNRLCVENDILIGRYGASVGKILTNKAGAYNVALMKTIPNLEVLNRSWFYDYLISDEFQSHLLRVADRSAQAGFSKDDIYNFPVPVPQLSEQQRIVGILDEAFDGIATAKANAERNLQNAHALFDSHLQSVFAQRGDAWVERTLGDEAMLEIIDGDRGINYPKASDFHFKGHCLFLNTKNVRPDGFEFESTMFITAEKDAQLRKGKLKRDDVVLTTRGTIGNIGLYSECVPFDNIRINSGMLIFRPNKRALLPSFLFELLRSEIVKDQIRKQTTGAAQPQLPIKTLVNFTIPVPTSLENQRALVTKLRAFEPETKRLESIYQRKLDALDGLKKSLLHQAFSGEL
jgi:type I restriction enzyme S subunit